MKDLTDIERKAYELVCEIEKITCPYYENGRNQLNKDLAKFVVDEITKAGRGTFVANQFVGWGMIKKEIDKL